MSWFASFLDLLKGIFSTKQPETSSTTIPEVPSAQTSDKCIQTGCGCKTYDELFPENPVSPPSPSVDVTPTPTPTPIPTPQDEERLIVEKLASAYGFNPRTVRAIAKVESSGNPFREYKGLGLFPVLRFEPHWFNKYEKKNPMPFTNNGRGFSSIASETNHVAFQKAFSINPDAAIKATSFGKFQIMGFHFTKLGYKTPAAFLEAMKNLEGQYDAFVKFVMTKQTLRNVIMKNDPTITDFKAFARSYNGSGNVDNYSKKMEKAYNSLA